MIILLITRHIFIDIIVVTNIVLTLNIYSNTFYLLTYLPNKKNCVAIYTHYKFVLSFNMSCPGPGKHVQREYVGNLSNGVYLLLVKAKNNRGTNERLIKKIAIIK